LQWDVLDRFDHLVLSYEVGAVKPEEAIYHAALQAIECAPGETLYTDDIEPYVEQGRAVGLQAVQFTGTAQYLRDLRRFGVELPENLAVC
jgi:HAD superfamily hydrolase (TIGR01509 family)